MLNDKFRKLSLRVSALSLRERVFVFAAAMIVVFSLAQTLAIDSGQLRKRNAVDRFQMAESTIQEIAQQRQMLGGAATRDPDQAARNMLAAQQAKLAELNAELETRGRALIPPERMQQMLKDVGADSGRHQNSGLQNAGTQTRIVAGCGRRCAARVLPAWI